MRLKVISEIQYKETTTNMSRKNIGSQYGATDLNDTLHAEQGDEKHPRNKQRMRQRVLQVQFDKNLSKTTARRKQL
jgi:hypothetical protein